MVKRTGEDRPEVTRFGVLDMQVCVPADWTDKQVLEFANRRHPTGIRTGWVIRKEGNEWLQGAKERQPCEDRKGFVHIMLDC